MSHGVSFRLALSFFHGLIPNVQVAIVLFLGESLFSPCPMCPSLTRYLLVYGGYLVFQLWSHSYLYSDVHNRQSPVFAARESKLTRSFHDLPMESRQRDADDFLPNSSFGDNSRSADNATLPHPVRYPVYSSPSLSQSRRPSVSQFTLSSPDTTNNSRIALNGHYGESTVRLVPPAGGCPMGRVNSGRSTSSSNTMIYTGSQDGSEKIESPIDISQDGEVKDHARDTPREPRIGLFLVVLVLVIVTVVSPSSYAKIICLFDL